MNKRKSMTTEDIRNRQWTESEIEAVRKASEAQAAGRDLPEEEYEDIPRLTEEQLASMVAGTRLAAFQRRRAPDPHQRYLDQPDGGGTADWGGEIGEFQIQRRDLGTRYFLP